MKTGRPESNEEWLILSKVSRFMTDYLSNHDGIHQLAIVDLLAELHLYAQYYGLDLKELLNDAHS